MIVYNPVELISVKTYKVCNRNYSSDNDPLTKSYSNPVDSRLTKSVCS